MASSLTYKGEEYMLKGTAALANAAVYLRLFSGTPSKDGTVTQIATGGGYSPTLWSLAAAGADWTLTPGAAPSTQTKIVLATKTLVASGAIANIAGSYIVDGAGNMLAWWERAGGAVSLNTGDTINCANLTVRFP